MIATQMKTAPSGGTDRAAEQKQTVVVAFPELYDRPKPKPKMNEIRTSNYYQAMSFCKDLEKLSDALPVSLKSFGQCVVASHSDGSPDQELYDRADEVRGVLRGVQRTLNLISDNFEAYYSKNVSH